MSTPVFIHSASMTIAFFISFFIFWQKKGTKRHKMYGRVFAINMAIGAISSFFIEIGKLSYIHLLSILTIYWLIKGVQAVRAKKKNWKVQHLNAMGSAYISLISAGIGVLVRHATTPMSIKNGFIATAIVVAIATPFLAKEIKKTANNNF